MEIKQQLIESFEDTLQLLKNTPKLATMSYTSAHKTMIYFPTQYPFIGMPKYPKTFLTIDNLRTFESARKLHKEFPTARIAVLNFASATTPGGGVFRGSKAQEESLCRCSTLYATLDTEYTYKHFYKYHQSLSSIRYSDMIIYSPNIVVFKSDDLIPRLLPEEDWFKVDVLTCAAPNLGNYYSESIHDDELLGIHVKRGLHLANVAAYNKADILVLGAFGCGAFRNNPQIVAKAYQTILKQIDGYFKQVTFSIYDPLDKPFYNYETFSKILMGE